MRKMSIGLSGGRGAVRWPLWLFAFYAFLILVLAFLKRKIGIGFQNFFNSRAALIGFAYLEYFGLKFLFLSCRKKRAQVVNWQLGLSRDAPYFLSLSRP